MLPAIGLNSIDGSAVSIRFRVLTGAGYSHREPPHLRTALGVAKIEIDDDRWCVEVGATAPGVLRRTAELISDRLRFSARFDATPITSRR
jgi:hypothetical protein